MTMRLWRYEDLNEIASLSSECFSQDPWNVRMLAESFLSPHFVGVLMEEDGAITAYGGGIFPVFVSRKRPGPYRPAARGQAFRFPSSASFQKS